MDVEATIIGRKSGAIGAVYGIRITASVDALPYPLSREDMVNLIIEAAHAQGYEFHGLKSWRYLT
jgi:hypothetical protein